MTEGTFRNILWAERYLYNNRRPSAFHEPTWVDVLCGRLALLTMAYPTRTALQFHIREGISLIYCGSTRIYANWWFSFSCYLFWWRWKWKAQKVRQRYEAYTISGGSRRGNRCGNRQWGRTLCFPCHWQYTLVWTRYGCPDTFPRNSKSSSSWLGPSADDICNFTHTNEPTSSFVNWFGYKCMNLRVWVCESYV